MFDSKTVNVSQAPAYPQTINEYRAPTDESLKILSEMEDKVKARIVASALVKTTAGEFFYCVFRQAITTMDHEIYGRFILNDVEYTFRGVINHLSVVAGGRTVAFDLYRKALTNVVVEQLAKIAEVP